MYRGMSKKDTARILIQKAQCGDRDAFAEIFDTYRHRLAGLIESRMGPGVRSSLEVDDVLQEAFARAFQSLDRFRWRDDESFIRWLGGIAENIILQHARAHTRRRKFQLTGDVPASGASPSRSLRRNERFERLQGALDALTPEQREIIRLLRIEGLKIREVAARTGRSAHAVKQLMLRGLRRLRANIRESESLHLPDRPLDFGEEKNARTP